jgi:hypothetical protein
MRSLQLLLPVLLIAACETGGVKLDDTGPLDADTDTDTDSDTDSDADSDADSDIPPGQLWSGTVEVMNETMGGLFCDGPVQLGIDGSDLEGSGDCEIAAGPGVGEIFGLDFVGSVEQGVITGTVSPVMEQAPQPPPPVDFTGTVDAEQLLLDFAFEVAPPEEPQDTQQMLGSVLATPVD